MKKIFLTLLAVTGLFVGVIQVDASKAVNSTCGTVSNPCPPDYFMRDQNGGTWGITGGPGNWVLIPQGSTAKSHSTVRLSSQTLPKVLEVRSICTRGIPPVCHTSLLDSPSVQTAVPLQNTEEPIPVKVVPPVITPVPVVSSSTFSKAGTLVETNVIRNEIEDIRKVITNPGKDVLIYVATSTATSTATTSASVRSAAIIPRPVVCSYLNIHMSRGSKGDGVLALQNFLKNSGYLSANATGYYGQMTAKAIQDFQTANGIKAVGSAGPITMSVIGKIACGK